MVEPAAWSPRDRTREELFDTICGRGDITRAELVASTGLSRSTINQAVGKLLAEGRLAEVTSETKGPGSGRGRPGIRLRAITTDAAVAGIDFGHTHVHVGLADNLGTIIAERKCALDVDLHAADAMDTAAAVLHDLRREHGVSALAAVVAGIPGPVGRQDGVVRSPTILSGWVGLDPAAELSRRTGSPVTVENDAVLGALGELYCGTGRSRDNFLYVKASHGIGAGVVIDGRPYRGATGLAGEIGHTNLPGRAELCRCGNRGCLEAVVSAAGVCEQIAHTRPGTTPAEVDLGAVDDPIAVRILTNAGRILGQVLADLCNLLNPDAVIIGGELSRADGPFLDGVRESIQLSAQPATAAALTVQAASLGVRAELIGAIQLAVHSAGHRPRRAAPAYP